MGATLQIVFDCADADRLARFWAEALGYVPAPRLVELGARVWLVHEEPGMPDYYAVTLQDPEGNEFCLN